MRELLKGFGKTRKILFGAAAVLVCIRLLFVAGGRVEREPYDGEIFGMEMDSSVACTNIRQSFTSERERLRSVYLLFEWIEEEKKGTLELTVYKAADTVFKTSLPLSSVTAFQWKELPLNLPLEPGVEYTVQIKAAGVGQAFPSICTTRSEIPLQGGVLGSSNIQGGNLMIGLDLEPPADGWNKLVVGSADLLFLFLFYLCLKNTHLLFAVCESCKRIFEKGFDRKAALLFLFEAACCLILFSFSEIPFQAGTKLVFLLVSFVAALGGRVAARTCRLVAEKQWQKVLLALLYLYTGFALVGSRLFVYPFGRPLLLRDFLTLAAAVGWSVPVINLAICLMDSAGERITGKGVKTTRRAKIRFALICTALLLIPALYALAACNPCISSADTVKTMVDARQLHGQDNWHPLFYNIWLRLILTLWDTPYAVVAAQYLFWLYVMLEFLFFLRRQQIKDGVLFGIAFLSGINAANLLQVNTIWKDVPYTFSLVWLSVLMAKLCFEQRKKGCFVYFELFTALVCTYFFRKNGVVPFALCAVILLLVKRRQLKVWCAVAASVLAIALIQGPVYSYFEVKEDPNKGLYVALSQDILGVWQAGGQLSEKTVEIIDENLKGRTDSFAYCPTFSYSNTETDIDFKEFILCYIDTFVRNPVEMTRSILAREDVVWSIFPGEGAVLGCVAYTGISTSGDWLDYYPDHQHCSLTKSVYYLTGETVQSQWLSAIVWRSGVWTLLALCALVLLLLKGRLKSCFLIFIPFAGQLLGLVLSTGWSDFRYFWPLNLMSGVILFAMMLAVRGGGAPEVGAGQEKGEKEAG